MDVDRVFPQGTCTYEFPVLNGQVLRTEGGYSFSTEFDIGSGFLYPAFFVIQLAWDPLTAYNFTDSTSVPTVALVILIRTSTQEPNPGDVLAADLCALSFCAQKRNVSVSLNQQSSTVLQTVYGNTYVVSKPANQFGIRLSFTGDDFNMTFSEMSRSDNFLAWSKDLTILIKAFEGSLNDMSGSGVNPEATSNFIGAFNASSNISMTMDNIATAMTNYIRDSSNVTVTGQAGQTESYVHVNWPWITLPAFLVLAGTIFLFLAMFETKRLGAGVWKTSELALLFHGLEESCQDLNALDRSSEMEHVASGIRVKMVKPSGGKWILRRETPPIKSI